MQMVYLDVCEDYHIREFLRKARKCEDTTSEWEPVEFIQQKFWN